jgi:hypothetical protein
MHSIATVCRWVRIPSKPLQDCLDLEDTLTQDEVIKDLTDYALVTLNREGGCAKLTMHCLKQEAAMDSLKTSAIWIIIVWT